LCCLLLPHGTYFIRQFLVLVLFVGYCFGEILCIWDSYVYQKGVLCFLIRKSYVRSIESYCFVRKCAAIPVQLEIFILQNTGWCVLIIRTFIFNQFGCFCQFLMGNFGQSIMSVYILSRCQLLTCCSNVNYYYYYSLSPLCRVFTNPYLKQTMFLGYIVMQLFYIYNSC